MHSQLLLNGFLGLAFRLLSFVSLSSGGCPDPSPAFPPPQYDESSHILKSAFVEIEESVKNIVSESFYDTSSFSIEVTSSKQTLWSLHHTAREKNESRPGAKVINGATSYRIASITKVFTVLAIIKEHAAGRLDLDDTIDKYIPELTEDQKGGIPWKEITLRTLANQLSGLPNDWAQSDLINDLEDPAKIGLPPVSKEGLPHCDEYARNYEPACTRKDLLATIRNYNLILPSRYKSTYCNTAYELLGLVLEGVTGESYAECIASAITGPLGMDNTWLAKPDDSVAVIPKGNNYFDVDEGVQNPTGGLYSTTNDLSIFLRYVLTHYNSLTPTLNWLLPTSYSTGIHNFFGMPWEIFRTDKILESTNRPVTFATKGGGLPAYYSIIMALPEYNLGITILVGGKTRLLYEFEEAVTVPLVRAAEAAAQRELTERYAGTYNANGGHHEDYGLNSSLTLAQSAERSLYVREWISNGTDALKALGPELVESKGDWRLQLTPTLLFRDAERQKGEIWRAEFVSEAKGKGVWDDFCITHVDDARYAGVPLNEVVFWGEDGLIEEVELPAFRVRLQRQLGGLNPATLLKSFWQKFTQQVYP